GGLSQPLEARHGVTGRSDGRVCAWPATATRVGRTAADQIAVQHLHQYRSAARADQSAERLEHLLRAVSRADRLSVFRGAARRQAHLLGELQRPPGRDQAGASATRSARAAVSGSGALSTAPITATPAAPAALIGVAFRAVIPPIPMTGSPSGARFANPENPAGPRGGPASPLVGVAKQGPILQ